MRLKNILLTVEDIEASKSFYHDLFGLSVILEQEGNIIMTEGLVLQEKKIWEKYIGTSVIGRSSSCELYFEEKNIEDFVKKMKQLPDRQSFHQQDVK